MPTTIELAHKYVTTYPCERAQKFCAENPEPYAAIEAAISQPVHTEGNFEGDAPGWHFVRYAALSIHRDVYDRADLRVRREFGADGGFPREWPYEVAMDCAEFLLTWLPTIGITRPE